MRQSFPTEQSSSRIRPKPSLSFPVPDRICQEASAAWWSSLAPWGSQAKVSAELTNTQTNKQGPLTTTATTTKNSLNSSRTKPGELQNAISIAGFQKNELSLQARKQWAHSGLCGVPAAGCSPALKLSRLLLWIPEGPQKCWPWNKSQLGILSLKGFIQEKERIGIMYVPTWWAMCTKTEEVLYRRFKGLMMTKVW